jgi:hypothetical protein
MTKALRLAIIAGLAMAGPTLAWSMAGSGVAGARATAGCAKLGQAGAGAYPTFCAIPEAPRDVRGADAFKAAVVETRLAGRQTLRDSAPDTFLLPIGGAEAFAADARARAAYPSAAAAPAEQATRDFADAARARATPPKPRHP